jgi:hypothetical protein
LAYRLNKYKLILVKIVLLASQSKAELYAIGEMKEYNRFGRNTCAPASASFKTKRPIKRNWGLHSGWRKTGNPPRREQDETTKP